MSSLNQKELKKLSVIKSVINKEKTQKEAAEELEITDRQVRRLIVKFKNEGENGFIHKNRGRKSEKKISNNVIDEIVNTYLSEYHDYNFRHFYVETGKKINVSYTSLFRIFQEEDIISPEAQHKTVKLYNESMRKSIEKGEVSEPKKKLYEERQKEEEQKHIRRSSLRYNFGQELQMDATFGIWFGNIECALHLVVDKASKKVLYGWFDYQETTRAYFILLMNTILNYGIPKSIKTDRRGSFSINNAKYQKSNLNTTQFGRICRELSISLFSNSNPVFKPNAERENRTFKGRLKAELRHENINIMEDANRYMNEVFIPKLNKEFSYEINPNKNDMRVNDYTEEELNIIISERYTRKIDNASAIKFQNEYYVPVKEETGEVVSFSHRTECIVVVAYDNTLWGIINEDLYYLLKIEKREEEQNTEIERRPAYKGHKPAQDHPWAYQSVKKEKEEYEKRKLCRENSHRNENK